MTSVTKDGVVEFRFFRPNVRQVNVVGDFNQWCRTSIPMRAMGEGWWALDLQLASGDYRFRYFAEGQWYTDYASNGIEKGKWGTNSMLVVQQSEMSARPDTRQVA